MSEILLLFMDQTTNLRPILEIHATEHYNSQHEKPKNQTVTVLLNDMNYFTKSPVFLRLGSAIYHFTAAVRG